MTILGAIICKENQGTDLGCSYDPNNYINQTHAGKIIQSGETHTVPLYMPTNGPPRYGPDTQRLFVFVQDNYGVLSCFRVSGKGNYFGNRNGNLELEDAVGYTIIELRNGLPDRASLLFLGNKPSGETCEQSVQKAF